MRLKIYGTGSALPAKKVSNDLLSEYMDTSDEWIRSRTGIVNRRLAMEETTSSLAVEAGRKALEDAKAAPEEVEIVIVATFTPDCSLPSTACIVQDQLGLTHAVAFDLNAACSGFLFALNTVQAYFSAGVYRTALVIGAENISKVVDWKDRGTCVLFGDGAGAALCRAEDGAACNFVQKSDGSGGAVLSLKERPIAHLFRECDEKPGKMYMGDFDMICKDELAFHNLLHVPFIIKPTTEMKLPRKSLKSSEFCKIGPIRATLTNWLRKLRMI